MRRATGDGSFGRTRRGRADRRSFADDEPRRIDLGGEREPSARPATRRSHRCRRSPGERRRAPHRRTRPVRSVTVSASAGASSSSGSRRRNATVEPSGDTRGDVSRTRPSVSRRVRHALGRGRLGQVQVADVAADARMIRRPTTTVPRGRRRALRRRRSGAMSAGHHRPCRHRQHTREHRFQCSSSCARAFRGSKMPQLIRGAWLAPRTTPGETCAGVYVVAGIMLAAVVLGGAPAAVPIAGASSGRRRHDDGRPDAGHVVAERRRSATSSRSSRSGTCSTPRSPTRRPTTSPRSPAWPSRGRRPTTG